MDRPIVKKSVVLLLALAVLLGFTVSALAEPFSVPGGPFRHPNAQPARQPILTFEEVEQELFKLEKLSKGAMDLQVVGHSHEGRALYAAVIGSGDTRMWIQGRIHGGEPYGAETSLEILRTLVAGGQKSQELLDEMTFMIIPVYNPDGNVRYWRGDHRGRDLNRDWGPSTMPHRHFLSVESRHFYDAWYNFKPHYALDIHHQGTFYVDDTNLMSTFSIGISLHASMPAHLEGPSRQMAVAAFDAVDKLGYANVTRYPAINIPEGVVSGMLLGVTAPGYDPPELGHRRHVL